MNKLKEVIESVEEKMRHYNPDVSHEPSFYALLRYITENACVEYARSTINKRGVLSDNLPQPHHLSEYNRGVRQGSNTLKQALLSRIDQDLTSLKEKKDT